MSQKESLLFGQTLIRISRIRAKVPGVIAFDVLVLCDDRNLFSRLNVGNLDCFQRMGEFPNQPKFRIPILCRQKYHSAVNIYPRIDDENLL